METGGRPRRVGFLRQQNDQKDRPVDFSPQRCSDLEPHLAPFFSAVIIYSGLFPHQTWLYGLIEVRLRKISLVLFYLASFLRPFGEACYMRPQLSRSSLHSIMQMPAAIRFGKFLEVHAYAARLRNSPHHPNTFKEALVTPLVLSSQVNQVVPPLDPK
jgi:hypothetical protein